MDTSINQWTSSNILSSDSCQRAWEKPVRFPMPGNGRRNITATEYTEVLLLKTKLRNDPGINHGLNPL
jgi:hypothetical protein